MPGGVFCRVASICANLARSLGFNRTFGIKLLVRWRYKAPCQARRFGLDVNTTCLKKTYHHSSSSCRSLTIT